MGFVNTLDPELQDFPPIEFRLEELPSVLRSLKKMSKFFFIIIARHLNDCFTLIQKKHLILYLNLCSVRLT